MSNHRIHRNPHSRLPISCDVSLAAYAVGYWSVGYVQILEKLKGNSTPAIRTQIQTCLSLSLSLYIYMYMHIYIYIYIFTVS